MTVAIVDYGSGNLHSAAKSFERAAREGGTGAKIVVTAEADVVAKADRIVLPGVGAYADCRRGLDAVDGMVEALERRVRHEGAPFLGICVGHQLMSERGLEKEEVRGLGWLAGDVVEIETEEKLPQIGWNTLDVARPHPILDGIDTGPDGAHAYFVHSYHLVGDPSDVIASADYGAAVTAIAGRGNMVGTQFHPEKSQRLGLALIANFLAWRP